MFVGIKPALPRRHAFCFEVDEKVIDVRIVEALLDFGQCRIEIVEGIGDFSIRGDVLAGNMQDQLTLAFVMLDLDRHRLVPSRCRLKQVAGIGRGLCGRPFVGRLCNMRDGR
ncbi:hypothetical protein AC628_29865 [Bradyrhizobium sp. NAS96.2]|nr:hypothetical protein AC628_29865 [Bradyrhizobium sp. NAS96.2]